jgi:hypothetical protein
MKILGLTISFLLLLTSCKETTNEAFDLNSFPKDWVRLTDLGRFISTYSNGLTSDNLFVTKDKQITFEKFDQPCRECWGDKCDETK